MTRSNTRRFVNAAWSLLTFQLIAAIGAVAVTGWAAFHVSGLSEPQASSNSPGTLTLNEDGSGNINASLSDPNGITGAPSIEWLRNGVPIPGVSGAVYATQRADLGTTIAARADYVDDAGFAESVISQPVQIAAPGLVEPPPLPQAVQIASCLRAGNPVRVDARAGWCDSGHVLQAGHRYLVRRGEGLWSNAGEPSFGPEGRGPWEGTIIAGAPLGALIGRVGDASFVIGEGPGFTSPATGPLYLSMNDVPGTFDDNQGSVEVYIYGPDTIQ
jgi:hypothetical protein